MVDIDIDIDQYYWYPSDINYIFTLSQTFFMSSGHIFNCISWSLSMIKACHACMQSFMSSTAHYRVCLKSKWSLQLQVFIIFNVCWGVLTWELKEKLATMCKPIDMNEVIILIILHSETSNGHHSLSSSFCCPHMWALKVLFIFSSNQYFLDIVIKFTASFSSLIRVHVGSFYMQSFCACPYEAIYMQALFGLFYSSNLEILCILM